MTKAEYISYIKNLLPQIDQTAKYHDNVVAMAISTAQEQMFNEMYQRGEKNLDQYARTYTPPTQPLTGGGWSSYLEFDSAAHFNGVHPVNIDSKSKGVVRIVSVTTSTRKFRPITQQEYEQMDFTNIGYYADIVWYYVDSRRIEMSEDLSGETLWVYMIPKFYDLNSDHNFNIPRGQGVNLMKYTLEALGVIPPKDLIADNSDQ